MQRFKKDSKKPHQYRLLISIILFLCILALFYFGTSALSGRAMNEQIENVNTQLRQSVVHCYCVEGTYPESLAYLEENYGFTYNKNRFFIDYQPLGQNMMPDITVIVRDSE